ncbi:MAG: hypothetical protein GTN78_00515 [Gemmatimonadales bacterium]|nr:hypothetical protein [Gemmatimonadales bacterium]
MVLPGNVNADSTQQLAADTLDGESSFFLFVEVEFCHKEFWLRGIPVRVGH